MDRDVTPAFGSYGARSARRLLRDATAASHRALETRPRMGRLLSAEPQRDDYSAVLRSFLPVHRLLEPAASELAGWAPGCSGERLAALRADLADLGSDAAEPPVPAVPVPADRAEAFGACYVLEGSFLGGTVIARHLRQHFGADLPLRYFAAPEIDRDRRWEQFLSRLEEALASDQARAAALRGAQDSYRWLQEVLP